MNGTLDFLGENEFTRIDADKRPVVRTRCQGAPVYQFGSVSVLGAPPQLVGRTRMQAGNDAPGEKIRLKKSWEIRDNLIGVCTTRMPRLPENDYQSLQVCNLIDGNAQTCWSSRPHVQPSEYPIWLRLDFIREETIDRVTLRKRPVGCDREQLIGSQRVMPGAQEIGRAMTRSVRIRTSTDALTWEEQLEAQVDPLTQEEYAFRFAPARCKQLLIECWDMIPCENWCFSFSIGAVEVYNEEGENIALLSRGTGIATNSANPLAQQELHAGWDYWPMHFDLGVKWSRIGYHDDPINWHWVEREKGRLEIDPECDRAVTMLAENGVEPVFCLNFGNRLYEGYAERRFPQLNEWYFENPKPPMSEEALEGWDRFVAFSVEHFRDRVKYFEVWNEWNGENYWGDKPDTAHYIRLARRTIPIIRRLAPEVRIVLGSYAGFCHDARPETHDLPLFEAIRALAPLVDAIGYHPFYQPDVTGQTFLRYPDNLRWFKRYCEACGFTGDTYMCSEIGIGAMYPPTAPGLSACWWGGNGRLNLSETGKARVLAQVLVMHAAMGVHTMFCELCQQTYPLELSLLKKGFDSYPMQAVQPNAAYFVLRTLSTMLEGLRPAEADFSVRCDSPLWVYALQGEGKRMACLWRKGVFADDCPASEVELLLPGRVEACALEVMNGERVPLRACHEGEYTRLSGLLARDYPLLIEYHDKEEAT